MATNILSQVRLRISASFRAVTPENTFARAVSSFSSQVHRSLIGGNMIQTFSRITCHGWRGMVPISPTFRSLYGQACLKAVIKDIPSLNEILGPQSNFFPPLYDPQTQLALPPSADIFMYSFKGIFIGVAVIYQVYKNDHSSSSGEDDCFLERLARKAGDIWDRLSRFCVGDASTSMRISTQRLTL